MSQLPLVYSCSGCSNVAQLANRIAVDLDRLSQAEMSCIAGLGGHVRPLVNKARRADCIIAIDGCPLACAKNCLAQHDLQAHHYFELSTLNIKKSYGCDCDDEDYNKAFTHIHDSLSAHT